MHFSERAIKIAIDKTTGHIVDADELFKDQKEAHNTRRQFHENSIGYFCCECQQDLSISKSKYDRVYFKHRQGHAPCILTSNELSEAQIENLYKIWQAKERPRHKHLKNEIGKRLLKVKGVDISSIAIDNKFIQHQDEKRRPDVYCRYLDHELAFEIQLSDLSLRYILDRHNFYRNRQIYLVWILDDFDVNGQRPMEKDIKYLNKYHNFFKLDEKVEDFKLECRYKVPFIKDNVEVRTFWEQNSVSLDKMNFDDEVYQVYYYDYLNLLVKKQEELQRHIEAQQKAEVALREQLKKDTANDKCKSIIETIGYLKKNGRYDYSAIKSDIHSLNEFEIKVLNELLNLERISHSQRPALLQWLHETKSGIWYFIEFILNCQEITLNVNEADADGITAFQEIMNNSRLNDYRVKKSLFKRGYILTANDIAFLNAKAPELIDKNIDVIFFGLCSQLTDKKLMGTMFDNDKLVYILESVKRDAILGFDLQSWIAFANNALQHRKADWYIIESAFKHYGLWNKLIALDKKGTFRKKLDEFYKSVPEQKSDFYPILKELYPEISL